jgi:hypothetical protein
MTLLKLTLVQLAVADKSMFGGKFAGVPQSL